MASFSRVGFIASLTLALALSTVGCSHKAKTTTESKKADLPSLVIAEDTPNLMLSWIDPHGDVHVTGKPSAVPPDARKPVRVLIKGSDVGTTDPIYVADLTSPSADGTYSTRSMSRQEWEDEIERRRGARVASLPDEERQVPFVPAPMPRPERAPPPPAHQPNLPDVPDLGDPPGDEPRPRDPMKNVGIVIYGASWCGPCHLAMKHLDKRHIAYTFKDIDSDAGANTEMSQKLARNHMSGGSIPVIDIGGRLLIGYDPSQMDRALDQAGSGGTML